MRIYTKTGDNGTSGLFGGQRRPKNDARFDAVGTMDELNAVLGVLLLHLNPTHRTVIESIQHQLFTIGAHIATPYEEDHMPTSLPALSPTAVDALEKQIDAWETELPPLQQFILPGGGHAGAMSHLARAVCRRAERSVVSLAQQAYVHPIILQYLNRLSDLLFVFARLCNQNEHHPETPWKK